jgi:hypothetical protein
MALTLPNEFLKDIKGKGCVLSRIRYLSAGLLIVPSKIITGYNPIVYSIINACSYN